MTPPRAPAAIATAITIVLVAGCSAAGQVTHATPSPLPSTPAATNEPAPSATTPPASTPPATANPDLAVERAGRGAIRATVTDAAAKSWRLVVAGTGSHAGDRWTIEVDTGDMGPVVAASETINGHEGEAVELATLEEGGANGRICATRLPVCLDAATFRLPQGDGSVAATLVATDAAAPLTIAGGHAAWPSEPFVLGPWTTTDAVPWLT
jgi:hypothetical protein